MSFSQFQRKLFFAAVTVPFAISACNSNATTLPPSSPSMESVRAQMHPSAVKSVGPGFDGNEGLALDARGNLYVVDSDGGGGEIDQVTPPFNPPQNGKLTTIAECSTPQLSCPSFPWGDAVDSHGRVYVTTGGPSVYELSPTRKAPTAIGTNLSGVRTIAVDGSGNVYVPNMESTPNDQTIEKIAPPFSGPTRGHVTNIGSGLSSPIGVAVGADCKARCSVYVADNGTGSLKAINANGTVTTVASGFGGIYGVAVAASCVSSCTAYITDEDTYDVWKITPSGKKTRIAPTFQFVLPGFLAVDKKGDVFVSDSGCECPYGIVKEVLP